MDIFKKHIWKAFLLLFTCLLMASCRGSFEYDKGRSYNNEISDFDDAKFLFFIPVNKETTSEAACSFLIFFAAAFLYKYIGPGWHSKEIRTDIRDIDGEKIGSVGTGKYSNTYISLEEAEGVSYWLQLALVFLMTFGCIISWIFPVPTTWWIILTLISSLIGVLYTHRNHNIYSYVQVWKWVLVAICIICLLVY